MIKVLLLRNVLPNSKFGGIRKHCQELYELFQNDSQVEILPIENLQNHLIPFIKKRVYYWKELYRYMKQSKCDIVHVHGFATLDIIQAFVVAQRCIVVHTVGTTTYRYIMILTDRSTEQLFKPVGIHGLIFTYQLSELILTDLFGQQKL